MNSLRQSPLTLGAICLAWSLAMPAKAQTSEYRIGPGETVEINIASLPDHNLRAVVQTDGTIAIPEAGSITVKGLTPAELQMRLETVLPTKLFRVRAQDGRVQTFIIAPGDITSAIVAYRPVYVTGDVLTPGEQPYRPLITARQAIAVAGGYSEIRGLVAKSATDPADLLRDYQSLWSDYLKGHFHRERIKAEMKEEADFDLRAPAGSPLPVELASTIGGGEKDALKIALDDGRREQAYLETSMKAAAEQIDTLSAREKVEAAAEKADEQDLAKVSQLFKNGDQTNARVAEIRRSLLLTSTRRLGTLVELMRVRSQRSDYERQAEKSGNQKKIDLLNDLRDTSVLLANLEIKLRAAGAKLQAPSAVASVEPSAADRVQPHVTIVRWVGDNWQQLPAKNESEVLPGDVLEVELCRDSEQGSASCPAAQNDRAVDQSEGKKISMN
jgi:polysaccharide biosynthesis/export protein